MDSDRFDAFVRSLQIAASRRVAVSGVLGAGLGTFAAFLGFDDAAAKRKKKRKKKKCRGAFKKRCGRKCVNLARNAANCGACGTTCATGVCIHGVCSCTVVNDCPGAGCFCFARMQGPPTACGKGFPIGNCTTDDDCPLGRVCNVIGSCSGACLA
jgi:hypothetical protein